jgi:hypothetical protein
MSGMSEMGGKETTVFLSSIQKFKFFFFFFFWGDVEGATLARDGRWMDAGRTLRITPYSRTQLESWLQSSGK